MAYPKFNEKKAQNTFDKMFGKGAFNSGMAQAREVGRTTAQAAYEKDAYAERLRAAQAAAKAQAEAAKHKTYDDALTYWNDPKNKTKLKQQGADRNANDILNDPNLQAEIKSQGYKVNDYVDALYNAASDGKFRSAREYKQYVGGLKKDVAYREKNGDSTSLPISKNSNNNKHNTSAVSKKNTTNNSNNNGGLLGLFKGLGKGLDNATHNTVDFLTSKDKNPNDGERDGLLGFLDSTLGRASNKAQSLAIGKDFVKAQDKNYKKIAEDKMKSSNPNERKLGSELDKMVNRTSRKPKNALEKGADLLGAATGIASYIVPGSASEMIAAKGLNALKGIKPAGQLASKLATTGAEKGLSAIAKKTAKSGIKGASSGLVFGAGETGLRELIDGKNYTASDHAKRIGQEALFGALGNPVLEGLGSLASKGLGRLSKNNLPSSRSLQPQDALLGLPEPQKALPLPQLKLPTPKETPSFESVFKQPEGPNSPIPPLPDVMKAPLNFGRLNKANVGFGYNAKNEPKARFDLSIKEPAVDPLKRGQQYWQNRYEDFVNTVNKSYDMNRMTQEGLDQAWSKFAKYDEPVSLNQVVDLAYPKGFEAPTSVKPEPPAPRTIKNDLRADPRINEAVQGLFPPLSPKPKVSRLATMDEIVQNMQRLAPPKVNQAEVPNLEFRRSVPQVSGNSNLGQKLKDSLNPVMAKNPKLEGPVPLLKGLRPPVKTQEGKNMQGSLPKLSEMPLGGLKERGHIKTLKQSPNALEELKTRLNGTYKPITNNETVNLANKQIDRGLEQAVSFVKSAKVLKPEHVATAHRLIQEFQKNGQINQAVDIAEHIAEQGTKAGQAVQAFSIFDKLSPEGILVHAHRVADRVNAKLGPAHQKVTINTDTANQLTDLATTVQKMTNQKTVANDVINIMDKAKAGAKLSDEETKSIRQFVDDAKQFVSDIQPKNTKPKAPNKLIHPEIKNHVITFLDKQEEAARQRLAARKNRALSGLPVDDFYDYAVIGASKLAKGTVHLADFSEQMVKEFGQEVAPHIEQIYAKASEMVTNEVKRTTNRLGEVEKLTNKALKNGKLEPNDAENLRKFAISIGNMSGDAKIEASQELQATLQALERPSLLQKVSTTQTIAQLLNPKTLARNAIGNELFYRLERINKLVATPIDWSRSKLTGGERTVTFLTNNQGEYWKNWLKGAKAGLKGVNPEGLATQYDLHPNSFNGKWNPLTYLQKGLGASLKSFDYAGYKRAVNNTIGELATLRATNEGLTGQARKQAIERYIREADENVLMIADQYGKYATFQDNNILSVGLQKFKKGLNFGKEFGMGDLIIKYPKTPGALLARSLEYSPAGFLKSVYQIARPIYEGNKIGWNHVTESFTRALIGSAGVSGIAWFLADKGILTGTGSKDLDVANLEKQAGKAPYSLNTDALTRWVTSGFNPQAAEAQQGDHFVTYNWAQPIATGISIGANVNQNVKQTGNFNIGQAAFGALGGTVDTMVEQSVLQGVKKAFTSYPGQTTGDKITDIAGDLPASFVPTFANQVRQLTDNTSRNTYDPSKLQTFTNRATNKIPGAASSLPPAYDTLGNKKEVYQDKSNTLFNVLLNPSFVSRYNPSPEAKMVLDIINTTGDTSVAPRNAQKYLMIDGQKYDLTTQQYSEYQRRLGEEVKYNLQGLLPYADTPNKELLGKEVNRILDKAGRKVRKELKQEFR